MVEQAREVWSEPELLVLYHEVFWRLNLCLQIPPEEILVNVPAVLDSLEGEVREGVETESFFSLNTWSKELALGAADFREAWLTPALQVLRRARIQQDIENFDRRLSSIKSLGIDSSDLQSALAYEQCLFALAEADYEQTREHLKQWPEQPEDPYWLVRKAAVLVELGEVLEARALVEKTLDRLRKMRRLEQQDFGIISREGWCLRFLGQIDVLRNFGAGTTHRLDKANSERERELETYRCSPSIEMNHLSERIMDRPPPLEPTWVSEEQPDFDQGSRSRTMHFGSKPSYERLAPAINLLMATEISGLPPRIGNMSFPFTASYVQALQWIRGDFPSLWAALALRHDGIGIDKKVITRVTLSHLPDHQLERLFTAALQSVDDYIGQVMRPEITPISGVSHDQFNSAIRMSDLASRLSLRLGVEQRRWLLTLAFKAARTDKFRKHPIGHDLVQNLLKRSIPFLCANDIQEWLSSLTGFPLQGELGDDTIDYRWPDPFQYIPRATTKNLIRPKETEFAASISMLIETSDSENNLLRSHAILRLADLYEFGLLTKDEEKKFAKVLWSVTDKFGLPRLKPEIYKSFFLELPEVNKGQAAKGLLRWLKKSEVQRRFSREPLETDAKNESKLSLSNRDPDSLLRDLIQLDNTCRSMDIAEPPFFTPDLRAVYLDKILDWWRGEKDDFSGWAEKHIMFSSPFDRIDLVFEALVVCILGNGVPLDKQSKPLAKMLEEMEKFGAPLERAIPIQAALTPERYSEYFAQLRAGLLSKQPDEAYRYSITFWNWETNSERLGLPFLPEDIYGTIFTIVGGVIQPAARTLMNVLTGLIERELFPQNDHTLQLLKGAVDQASNVLAYSQDVERLDSRPIDPEEIPHLRRRLALLISTMKQKNLTLGKDSQSWWEDARKDVYIDLRIIVDPGQG